MTKTQIVPNALSVYEMTTKRRSIITSAPTVRPATISNDDSPITISVREMLWNVKDSEGNSYINPDGTANFKLLSQNSSVLNQAAYHGTPHNFDSFDLGAIGTGEGAQAHGWGLYFAKDKKVSESYRETLTYKARTVMAEKLANTKYSGKTVQEWYEFYEAKLDTLNPRSEEFDVARIIYGLLESTALGDDPRFVLEAVAEDKLNKKAVKCFRGSGIQE